uniref:Class I histocompatibility antigen, F10 alpha chain-like n=10 Tax=Cyanistes caeruleus TaxID=156563 RepID=A0A8C0U6T2_CYACU
METRGAGMGSVGLEWRSVGLGWELWGWDGDPWTGMGSVGLGWDLWGWDTIPWVSVGSIPPGLHTIQRVSGCDLLSDGSVRGSWRYGYDGRDFISFELGSKNFVAADDAAEITRRRWEDENEVERRENYQGHVCPEWLRKYVGYGRKELERKVVPDVHVSGKEEHGTLILSCHVYGFYPNTITVNWMKGGEIWDQETEWGGIVPNSDGTFHTWARIEALPEEWEQYRCRVEHPDRGAAGGVGAVPVPGGASRNAGARDLRLGADIWRESRCGDRCVRHRHPRPCPHWIRCLEAPIREEGREWIQPASRKGHGNEWLNHTYGAGLG